MVWTRRRAVWWSHRCEYTALVYTAYLSLPHARKHQTAAAIVLWGLVTFFLLTEIACALDVNVYRATVGFVELAHGFPHEICVDGRDGAVFAAAVDTSDLPKGTGIAAMTKYLPAAGGGGKR